MDTQKPTMTMVELLMQFDDMIDKMQSLFEQLQSQMNKALETRNALVAGRQKILAGCKPEELAPLLEIIKKAAT